MAEVPVKVVVEEKGFEGKEVLGIDGPTSKEREGEGQLEE